MAAGLGFKTFNTGDVLSAADVNGYLMQGVWVFANTTARNAAVTSPQAGNMAYTTDTNTLWKYTGSAWANVDTSGTSGALTLVSTNSFSASSAVNVDSVFTSTYANYMIIVNLTAGATNPSISFRLRSGGTTTSSGYQYGIWDVSLAGGSGATGSGTASGIALLPTASSQAAFKMDLICPQEAQPTKAFSQQFFDDGSSRGMRIQSGNINNTTAYDGFSLTTTAGTITGNYYLYGYQKA